MLKPNRDETERNWNDDEASFPFLENVVDELDRFDRSYKYYELFKFFNRSPRWYVFARVNGFARTGGGGGGGELGNTGSLRATSVRLVAASWAFSVV